MNKRHYEHTLPNIRGSLSNTYFGIGDKGFHQRQFQFLNGLVVGGVKVCFLPTVHHVPKEVQPGKSAGFILHQ